MSVIIPTFNRVARLRRVLVALADQVTDEPFEVVVVSDGSTDGTDEYLAGGDPPLHVVAVRQPNAGAAAARNRAVDVARGELIVFIDDDLVPAPRLLAEHLAAHASLGDDVVVIGPMLDPLDVQLPPWTRWEQRMLQKQYAAMERGEYAATARQFYTGNASLRREHFLAVGGFDPRFRRMEDVELAYRLDDIGLRWVFVPTAIGYHYAERSYASWLSNGRDYGRNDVVMARAHARDGVLDTLASEYRQRNALVRLAVKVLLPSPTAANCFQRSVERFSRTAWSARTEHLTSAVLSGAYNEAYYRGVATELGGHREFRELVERARP